MSQLSACILGVQGAELGAPEAAFFRDAAPWGFVLFARNVETPDQLRRLTGDLRAAVGRDAPIFVDQEGGRVQRLRAPHWHDYAPPLDQARFGPASFHLRGRMLAAELRAVGIDGNFAPCADLAWPETHPFLRSRCMGTTVAEVAANARALADGLLTGGVLPVVKHMPGHGRATQDSHLETPLIDQPRAALETTDFAPFKALADLPLGMTAHIRLPFLGDLPATMNPAALAMMRKDWGFAGAIMTDDIGMGALTGPIRDRAAGAVAAGCDLVLHCNDGIEGFAQAAEGAGLLTGAALARCEQALAARRMPESVDFAALAADLSAMTGPLATHHG
ncbi:glycoside hydrolase family 3 N-terminal domain-containing protein [Gemmobacter nectariphilus]|uniref:glycoside hydrolase family 3 N-terminal domain-containing protein n=1 Tax=Gemmobacter nectariphilus TaxID=220343 RepID=UPI00041CB313|nr:glycoside hydrolase family 3 N-terminal domain-containing protein [Gemmobacter nectariphilus]